MTAPAPDPAVGPDPGEEPPTEPDAELDDDDLDPGPEGNADGSEDTTADDPGDDGIEALIANRELYEQIAAEDAEADGDDDPDDSGDKPASAREARYRVRAREAEQRVETQGRIITELQDHLAAMYRAEAERQAVGRLADPEDLWVATQLDDLLGEDGRLDPKRVDQVIGELLNRRPHWGIPSPRRYGGLLSGASNQVEPRGSGWSAAFGPTSRD